MGRNSKWIEAHAEDATRDVARRALAMRLERMWHFLEQAIRQPESDTENVHQLRVFSRRSAATLETFEQWLPARRGRWVGKQVKRVRRAAGDARDLDVLEARWSRQRDEFPADEAEVLLEHVRQCRHAAQPAIHGVYRKLVDKRLNRRARKLIKRVRWRGEPSSCAERFGCMARVALEPVVAEYLLQAHSELADPEALHMFRIQGKRVRYRMEIFAGAFDLEFREQLYPLVAALQDRLGTINDHVTALGYLDRWLADADARLRDALRAARRLEEQMLEASRREFLNGWTHQWRGELGAGFARYFPVEPERASARGA